LNDTKSLSQASAKWFSTELLLSLIISKLQHECHLEAREFVHGKIPVANRTKIDSNKQ